MTESISLPISHHEAGFWGLVLGLILLTGLLYGALSLMQGKRDAPVWESLSAGWLAILVPLAVIWVALFVMTIGAALIGTWKAISDPGVATLGLGGLIVALLGGPFLIWGTVLKHRALDLSNATFFHDKVNDALTGLYSRRQETRSVIHDGEEKILTEWQDDILQRSAAIDRLEGLVREKPSEAPRIADMLSVYVCEVSRKYPAQEHPRLAWLALVEPNDYSMPMSENDALYHLKLNPDAVTVDALLEWCQDLQPFRTDVEQAARTLGRLQNIPGVSADAIRIDLRGTNLQGFDLKALNFTKADFSNARMEGAILCEACLDGARLAMARMEGANFFRARIDRASLNQAWLVGANLKIAMLKGADLTFAHLEHAGLAGAKLGGADLTYARINGAVLWGTDLFNAHDLTREQIETAFGDGSVLLPMGMDPPAHWPKQKLGYTNFHTQLAKWRDSPSTYTPPD